MPALEASLLDGSEAMVIRFLIADAMKAERENATLKKRIGARAHFGPGIAGVKG